MTPTVLWKRLTLTDFNAMHGKASPQGRGGGAMHIALGVRTPSFPIDKFVGTPKRTTTVRTPPLPGEFGEGALTFGSNPNRRGGEWLIGDQFSHRHPAWSADAGFPTLYDSDDPPVVLIFRVGDQFHVRYFVESRLSKTAKAKLPEEILTTPKGIIVASDAILNLMRVPGPSLVDDLQLATIELPDEPFDPKSVVDGRKRIIAAVVRRLGQQAFRRSLLSAYDTQCAITRCRSIWVLEAAHITPYRGIRTNAVSNGLLLRADIHTLFDLALIAIEPRKMRVRVSSTLAESPYRELDGVRPWVPRHAKARPSPAAIEEHFHLFQP